MSKRVALYVRVSTLEQKSDMQRRELFEFVKARGWEVVREFEDKCSGKNANRPRLKEMMAMAERREFDVVLVWKLDRFGRSLSDLIALIQRLTEVNAEFVSLKDNFDLTTSQGRLMLHMLGAFAQFERDLIVARVRSGIAAAKAKGKTLGRPKSINTDLVVKLRTEGKSLSQIARRVGATKSGVSKTLNRHLAVLLRQLNEIAEASGHA